MFHRNYITCMIPVIRFTIPFMNTVNDGTCTVYFGITVTLTDLRRYVVSTIGPKTYTNRRVAIGV